METEVMTDKMENVLTQLKKFLSDSEESMFASKMPEDLLAIVSENLSSVVSNGCLSSPEQMINMFLPTASLQEIAMDNGWGSQYIDLADYFEQALESYS